METYPAGLGQDVMRLRLPSRHGLASDALREWDVHKLIPVNVPDFPAAETILQSSEAMRPRLHPSPTQNGFFDSRASAMNHWDYSWWNSADSRKLPSRAVLTGLSAFAS
jgi:hypothetical protein